MTRILLQRCSALVHALAAFLRGFTGMAPLPRDPAGVRCALEQRAGSRRSCC
jgi:hypothetical protein